MSQTHYLECGHGYDVVPSWSWGCPKCAAGLPADEKPVAAAKPRCRRCGMYAEAECDECPCCAPVEVNWKVGDGRNGSRYRPSGEGEKSEVRLSDKPDDSHYKSLTPEPIDVINAWNLNFNLGNVVKYVARCGRKAGVDPLVDLAKARDYIDFEIKRLGGN